jgi:hypothetical protein
MVRCALTDKEIPAQDAYWAPPLVTFRELMTVIFQTLTRNPSNFKHILFAEQPDVPYDPDIRDELASRRSAEQMKLALLLLAIVALIIVPLLLLVKL